MATMLIAFNGTRENGNFMGDQLCLLKTCYLFVKNAPDVDRVIMSVSPGNEMAFIWQRFIDDPRGNGSIPRVELVYDTFDPGNWPDRWEAWDKWRTERSIEGIPFDTLRECYLRIHGAVRQTALCGSERGLGRKNIYEYWIFGQENMPNSITDVDEWDNHGVSTIYSYGDNLVHHPPLTPERDVYISPHAKTQGNATFTMDFWAEVCRKLLDAGLSVTVGYDGYFREDLNSHPLYRKYWGDHQQWMQEICRHRIISCGNTGTGWLAAACGTPIFTCEPPNSVMADHRYRECGLRNLVEVLDTPDADYCAKRLIEEVRRVIVMTTGCYDVIHAGHIRHLERSRALGSKLIVAMNSDESVRAIKGSERPINRQSHRKAVLESLRCVDEVRLFDGPDATDLIREIKPDILTNGFGYTLDKVVGREIVEGYGGKVVITCTGDAKDEPSTTKIVKRVRQADVAELCRVACNASVNPFEKLKLMADQFLSVKELPGDVADLGAYKGGTSLILRRLAPEKHLHIFDTWEGTPYDDPLCHHRKGEWKASQEECQKLVGNGPLTSYVKGVFPDTAERHVVNADTRFSFVYVDMDVYDSVRDAIDIFWPLIVPGGMMMFDDWNWEPCSGVNKAILEKFSKSQLMIYDGLHTCTVTK